MDEESRKLKTHQHNGRDSLRIKFSEIKIDEIQNAIGKPSGGATVDSQARAALNSIIDVLKNLGLTQ